MKKIIMVLVSGVIYTSLITGYATAQGKANISFEAPKADNNRGTAEGNEHGAANITAPADKTAIKEMEANLKAAKVNLKVTNHLDKNFKNVSGVKWNTEEKAIIATFKMNDKAARVVYDKRGNWLYTILTYPEDQLPRDIRSLVKESYSGFTISLVQEISQGNISLYKVHLEDSTSYKQILVHDGEITVYEDFIKSR